MLKNRNLETYCLFVGLVLALASPIVTRAQSPDNAQTTAQVVAEWACGQVTGTTSASCSTTSSSGGTQPASASAVASLTSLSIGADAEFSLSSVPSGGFLAGSSTAGAEIGYLLDVTGGPSSGTIVLSVTTNGTLQVSQSNPCNDCVESTYADLQMASYSADLSTYYGGQDIGAPANGTNVYTFSLPYDNGTAFVEELLSVKASCQSNEGTCDASANFLDTVQVTGAQIYDSSGNLVSGAVIETDWGLNLYPPVSVPEPATLSLIGLCLAGVGFARRLRKS